MVHGYSATLIRPKFLQTFRYRGMSASRIFDRMVTTPSRTFPRPRLAAEAGVVARRA